MRGGLMLDADDVSDALLRYEDGYSTIEDGALFFKVSSQWLETARHMPNRLMTEGLSPTKTMQAKAHNYVIDRVMKLMGLS